MKKSTKVMVALGVVAGLGVAALPLGSTGALAPTDQSNPTVTLTANVGTAYAISAAAPAAISVNPNGAVASETANVVAAANGPYKVVASSTALDSGSSNIPVATDELEVKQGNSAWGISGGDISAVSGIGGTGKTLKASSDPSATSGDTIEVTYSVSAAANQPTGTYETSVTYTIGANNS